jgi:lysozyme
MVKGTQSLNLSIIKKYEGLKLEAYLCPAGVATVGFGSTFYPDGRRVKLGDKITLQEAESILLHDIKRFEKEVRNSVKIEITNNQLSALVSFVYNVGASAFRKSTLLRKVNANPTDLTIHNEFMRWTRAGGKVLPGLVKRRAEESKLYFTK